MSAHGGGANWFRRDSVKHRLGFNNRVGLAKPTALMAYLIHLSSLVDTVGPGGEVENRSHRGCTQATRKLTPI